MLLLDRIRRLITANVRELVESAKDPELVLLEFVADLECSYGEVKAEMVDLTSGAARLEHHLLGAQSEVERWDRKAMVAINQGEDQLAREALVRKARAASLASQMKLELKEQLKLADSLRQTLEDLQHKLRESQEQRDHLLASNARAASADRVTNVLRSKSWWTKDSSLERLTQEVLDRQHRLEGYQELHRSNVETEFLRLPSDQNIESELKRLKGIASKDKQ